MRNQAITQKHSPVASQKCSPVMFFFLCGLRWATVGANAELKSTIDVDTIVRCKNIFAQPKKMRATHILLIPIAQF
jgi:hypothetical protein